MRGAFALGALVILGCSGGNSVRETPAFSLTVEEMFYIKPPVDRVILVGTITEGSVQTGDSLVVKSQSGDVGVVVEAIEHPSGAMQKAEKGQQVGLKLSGLQKDRARR